MRIISNGIDFDLPTGFAAELSRNNVMLTDAGEQTAPITLPGTPNNLKLVGYSDRTDNYYKPLTDLDVIVSDGLFNRPCNLSVHTANEEDGISATIYLGTGDFYSKVVDRAMSSLAWPMYQNPLYIGTTDPYLIGLRVQYLINLLKAQYGTFDSAEIFRLAPVATSQSFTNLVHRLKADGTYEDVDVESLFVLNGFEQYRHLLDFSGDGSDGLDIFQGEYVQQQKVNSNYIDISLGYGMTPFLKVRYLIDFIFTSFGYTFDSRALEERVNEYADDIVLLNNVADAIYSGQLKFSQLVPNVTIKEFIAAVEKFLVGKFIFNEITKTVAFWDYEGTLSLTPDMDMSDFAVGKVKPGAEEFTLIKTIDTGDGTAKNTESKIKTETIDFDFIKEITISAGFNSPDTVGKRLYAELKMATIDGITHANTSIEIDGIIIDGKPEASTNIQFININSLLETAVVNPAGVALSYYRSYRLFTGFPNTSLDAVDSFYTAYKNFRLNSNIPIEIEMDIPEEILEKMIIQNPKLLQGQPVLIESIVQTLGKKGNHKVNLRTLRPYVDR